MIVRKHNKYLQVISGLEYRANIIEWSDMNRLWQVVAAQDATGGRGGKSEGCTLKADAKITG